MSPDLHHLAGAYALDALDADERRAFEAHYPTCAICAAEVADFRETAAALAEGTTAAPDPASKQRVMAEVGRTRQLSVVGAEPGSARGRGAPRRRTIVVVATAAAALLLIGGIVGVVLGRSTGGDQVADVVAAADAVVTELQSGDGAEGVVRVVWSPSDSRVAVLGADVADAGRGRTYALWFLLSDGVAPAGLFQADDGLVRTVLTVDDLEAVGWGVTIEPAGGSPEPTGEVLFAGSL